MEWKIEIGDEFTYQMSHRCHSTVWVEESATSFGTVSNVFVL